jgi:hypothetical protein
VSHSVSQPAGIWDCLEEDILEIIIEIGTPENQAQIRQELMLFSSVVSSSNNLLNISKVIVPADFDAKVNELQGTSDYKSNRGVVALARNVNLGESVAIVLSPLLYTAYFDAQIRLYISLHEIKHVYNRKSFLEISADSGSRKIYLENLYTLFDEYIADRWALEVFDKVIPTKTVRWNEYIRDSALGFSSSINDRQFYIKIKTEIESFRHHSDIVLFQENIHQSFHNVAISLVHAFAIADYDSRIMSLADLMQSHFVNEKTLSLMGLFKIKYQEQIYDIHDDLNLIIDFMTNFGMKFEDTPQGIYCHVLDI